MTAQSTTSDSLVNAAAAQVGPLEADLLAGGYLPGPAANVSPDAVRIDSEVYQELECLACGRSGMAVRHYNRRRVTRGVARCRQCGAEEEV